MEVEEKVEIFEETEADSIAEIEMRIVEGLEEEEIETVLEEDLIEIGEMIKKEIVQIDLLKEE